MSNECIVTLLEGSGLCASILGIVFALVYMKKNNITTKLKVNVNGASAPMKYFCSIININIIEIIDMPIANKIINGKDHPGTTNLNGIELFYTPGLPGYDLFNTDYNILYSTFILFWNSLGFFHTTETEKYTCLHIRRGDKLIYEGHLKVHTIEEYIEKINECNLINNNILIVTDEYNTVLNFKNKYPGLNINTTCTHINHGFNITNINKECIQNVKIEVHRMINDLKCISKSNYFIGTTSSSVSFLGKLLRNNVNTILL
jgi:hypothetical protein